MSPIEDGTHPARANLIAAFILALAMFASLMCVSPIEDVIKAALSLNYTQTSLVFTAPILMVVLVSVPAGLMADRLGIRKAAGYGAVIMTLGAALRGTAANFPNLLGFALVFGVGFGMIFPNLPKLVSSAGNRQTAGLVTGAYTTGILVGIALALAITVPLVLPITHSFHGVFWFWSLICLMATIIWWVLVREPVHAQTVNRPPAAFGPAFRRVLNNRNLLLLAGLFFLHNFFFYTWVGWAPLLMTQKGTLPAAAALQTSVTIWAGIPFVLMMPLMFDKLGLRKPFLWGSSLVMGLCGVAAIFFNLTMIWPIIVLIGIANSARFPTILALPAEMVSPENVGAAGGLILSLGYAGAIVGPFVGGRVLDITGSLGISLLALVATSVAAAVIAWLLPETGPKSSGRFF